MNHILPVIAENDLIARNFKQSKLNQKKILTHVIKCKYVICLGLCSNFFKLFWKFSTCEAKKLWMLMRIFQNVYSTAKHFSFFMMIFHLDLTNLRNQGLRKFAGTVLIILRIRQIQKRKQKKGGKKKSQNASLPRRKNKHRQTLEHFFFFFFFSEWDLCLLLKYSDLQEERKSREGLGCYISLWRD